MLKIIGFVTGTLITAVVMLVFAGNVGGTGAQGELRELLGRSSPNHPTAEVDTAAPEGNEDSDAVPDLARTVAENIADAAVTIDRPPLRQPDPIGQTTETDEMESPLDEQEKEQVDGPVVVASDGLLETENAPVEAVPAPADDEIGAWYAFWTPFRSEVSANGFAARLGRDTDREYRVIRTGPGEYRVAFFHTDDNDRRARLVEIEQVSGLVLGGGEL
jgi:hypothetical protein